MGSGHLIKLQENSLSSMIYNFEPGCLLRDFGDLFFGWLGSYLQELYY